MPIEDNHWTFWNPENPANKGEMLYGSGNPSGVWVTANRAGKFLGVTGERVIVLVKCGRLFGRKCGNMWFVGMSSILALRRVPRGRRGESIQEKADRDTRMAGGIWNRDTSMFGIGRITTGEAAELMKVSVQRIHQLLKENRLTGERLSWGWVVDRESILRFTRVKRGPKPKSVQKPRA